MSFGKGSNTTTSQTGPSPDAMAAYQALLSRASGVASQPYTPYGGELTAGVNSQQTAGINNVNANAGFANPYIQQAGQAAQQGAASIDPSQIQQYENPFTSDVIDATQAQFAHDNAVQQNNVVGNAAAQHALGGNRVGVAQALTAEGQQRAQAPVIAGLQAQNYQQALTAAQADRAARAQGAFSLANVGVAGQNAALQGAGAQIGAGTLQQQTQQAADTANYGQFAQEQAFPYQQTQWLAGIDTGVGSQMGGTSSTTPPQPNPWSTYGGLALAGLGLFAKNGGRINGYATGGTPWADGVGWIPNADVKAGRGAPSAPNVSAPKPMSTSGFADAGKGLKSLYDKFSQPGDPIDLSSGAGVDLSNPDTFVGPTQGFAGSLPTLYRNGGTVYRRGYDDGGPVQAGFGTGSIVPDDFGSAGLPSDLFRRRFEGDIRNPDVLLPPVKPGEIDARDIVLDENAAGIGKPVFHTPQAEYTAATLTPEADQSSVPFPRARPDDGVGPVVAENGQLPEVITRGLGRPDAGPSVMAYDRPRDSAGMGSAPQQEEGGKGLFGLSPAAKAGLLAAGLGMMASRSPNLGQAIGEGGLSGLGTYSQTKKDEYTVEHGRQQLEQQAEQAAKRLELETQKFSQSKIDTDKDRALKERELLQGKTPAGYRMNNGQLEFIPGGPTDPEVVKNLTHAKQPNGLLDDDTLGTMAEQYLAGDKSVMQNLGRGAQGAENIVRLRQEIVRQAKDQGLNGAQIATRMADFAGRTAAMRTLGTRGANVEYAGNTASRAIDLAEQASDKVPRTQFVPFNKLKQLYETNTSSPEQAAFYTATNTLVNEYARVASGGSNQATEGMRQHAREMLNTAQGPEAYKAVLGMMRKEIDTAKRAYNDTRKEFLEDKGTAHELPTPAAAPSAAAKPTLTEFLSKARAANPKATDAQLTDYYNKNYGAQ